MSAIKFIIDYIMNTEKTDDNLIHGMNCNPQYAYQEMILTKHRFHKTDGRQCNLIATLIIQTSRGGELLVFSDI